MKRPAVWLALTLIIGECSGLFYIRNCDRFFAVPVAVLILLIIITAAVLINRYEIRHRRKDKRKLLIVFSVSFFIAGLAGGMRVKEPLHISSIEKSKEEKKYFNGCLCVSDIKESTGGRIIVCKDDNLANKSEKLFTGYAYIYINTSNGAGYEKTDTEKEKDAEFEKLAASLNPGDIIEASGFIKLFTKDTNPGQFSSRDYYLTKEVTCYIDLKDLKAVKSYDGKALNGYFVKYHLYKLRKRFSEVIDESSPYPYNTVLKTILLGEKEQTDAEVKETFILSGISHIFAISGLHVTMMGMIFLFSLKKLGFGEKSSGIVSFILLWAYYMLTGFQVSAARALIMFLVMILSAWGENTYDPVSSAAAAAIIILVINPLQLKNSGFLLSLFAALGIGYASIIFKEWLVFRSLNGRLNHNLFVYTKEDIAEDMPFGIRIRRRLRYRIKKFSDNIFSTAVSSFSVWCFTFPICMMTFYSYKVYSIILNILVLPLFSPVVVTGFIGMCAGLFSTELSGIIFEFPCAVLKLYESACMYASKLPFANVVAGCPKFFPVICYYVILILILVFLSKTLKNIRNYERLNLKNSLTAALGKTSFFLARIAAIIFSCFLLITVLYINKLPVLKKDPLSISVLDVGQGDGIIMRTPDGGTVLFDGGSTSSLKTGEKRIIPYLEYYGIDTLDGIFISHNDKDHINGALEVIESGFFVKRVYLPFVMENDKSCDIIKNTAGKNKIDICYVKDGDGFMLGNAAIHCMFSDSVTVTNDENDKSMVIQICYGNFSMLLTGDITKNCENDIIKKLCQKSGGVNVLKVAHHGSKNSSGYEFLSSLKADISVLSCSKNNRYGHPHREVIERLNEAGYDIYYTMESGAITILTNGEDMQIEEYKKESRYI